MTFRELGIPGVFLIEPEPIHDARGFFARSLERDELVRRGLEGDYTQASIAWNATAGTVRGMHFQFPPHAEVKLVRCTRGAILDVVVDLRPESPTFGSTVSARLDAENRATLYVPERFAHGYQALVDDTEVAYQMNAAYAPDSQGGIHHADPKLAIDWPLPVGLVSERDATLPTLAEARDELTRRMAREAVR
jgi:dTDP-4-dehydrorhamnose 3,5-epimerase